MSLFQSSRFQKGLRTVVTALFCQPHHVRYHQKSMMKTADSLLRSVSVSILFRTCLFSSLQPGMPSPNYLLPAPRGFIFLLQGGPFNPPPTQTHKTPASGIVGPPEMHTPKTAAPTIVGPPEMHNLQPKTPLPGVATNSSAPSDPFIDQMVDKYNHPPMGLTENRSPTYKSSGNPCLDFFYHVVPDTPPDSVVQRLDLAWAHDPLTTLKLVCNLRGVRGTGKGDREGFYASALWLHAHHPKTLAANVGPIADFGYFKDLPEILYRLLKGADSRRIEKEEWERVKNGWKTKIWTKKVKRNETKEVKEARIAKKVEEDQKSKAAATVAREERRMALARKFLERYTNDSHFRDLHDRVSDHFAKCLKEDVAFLKNGKKTRISLAAKWCPSLYSSFDRHLLLCESIAKWLFPREEYPGVEEAHYAYRVRERLRKEVLVPLRKALEIPEIYMCANRWSELPYERVASIAMQLHKEKFLRHDRERFEAYLDEVKCGKKKIAAGALLPHEIIASLYDGENDNGTVADLQWKRMVDDLLKEGKLKQSMAICDVSGSMSGTPLDVSVALGLLVSELSDEPWKGKLITFSDEPRLHVIKGTDLRSKVGFIQRMDWMMNTDFQKVFDRLLDVAVEGKLKPEQMVKKLFVFSDMEFDQASSRRWETDYQAIGRKFNEAGYGDAVPQIVFWNLRDSEATPVISTQKGVALLSGFSKNLLKLFLKKDGVLNPEDSMLAAVSGREYQKLVVVD